MTQAAHRLRQLGFIVVMVTGALPAWAAPCALPRVEELESLDPPPDPSWAPQEKWVWKQTLAGEVADFNDLYCERRVRLDPRAGNAVWRSRAQSEPRQLSERFLLDVLTKPLFSDAIPTHGLQISGAWIDRNVDLSDIEFNRNLSLQWSRFEGKFSLAGAKLRGFLSFNNSAFMDLLDMAQSDIARNLLVEHAKLADEFSLFNCTIGGILASPRLRSTES